jgi:small subunit ribosomal protein S16
MVKIRLFRIGATKRPYYRVVAIDSRRARNGRVLENLGTYDPRGGDATEIKLDKVQAWVDRGAQLSDTVRSLLKRKKRALAAPPADSAAPPADSAAPAAESEAPPAAG